MYRNMVYLVTKVASPARFEHATSRKEILNYFENGTQIYSLYPVVFSLYLLYI